MISSSDEIISLLQEVELFSERFYLPLDVYYERLKPLIIFKEIYEITAQMIYILKKYLNEYINRMKYKPQNESR